MELDVATWKVCLVVAVCPRINTGVCSVLLKCLKLRSPLSLLVTIPRISNRWARRDGIDISSPGVALVLVRPLVLSFLYVYIILLYSTVSILLFQLYL